VERQLHGTAHLASHQQAVSPAVPVHGCSQQRSFWRSMPWHVKVCGSALHLRPRTDPDPSHNPEASSTLAPGSVRNSVTILDAENHNNNFNSTNDNNNASNYNDNNNNNHCQKDEET